MVATACPAAQHLREFVLGRLAGPSADLLDAHLAECPNCGQTLENLDGNDDLIASMRSLSHTQMPRNDMVEQLRAKVRSLRPPLASQAQTLEVSGATAFAAPNAPLPGGPVSPSKEVPHHVGRYRVLGQLGAGGMGTVYKGHDPQLNRIVAIKVPRFDGSRAAQEQGRQRFLREARVAAGVRHPHVCPIYDVGEQDGVPYVVMAFVEGESLADRLRLRGRCEDCREAVALMRQVGEGLAAVHGVHIVHRDLKPGNILLDRATGQPVLTDFGLARSLTEGEHLTADGSLLGTPAYMSPEQATQGGDAVGAPSDQYSLAVVLYQLLTGHLPFEGPVVSLLYQIGHKPPPPASEFRPDLDLKLVAILKTAMAREAKDRYPTVQAFVGALTAWLRSAAQAAAASARGGRPPAESLTIPPPLPGAGLASQDNTMALRTVPPPMPGDGTVVLTAGSPPIPGMETVAIPKAAPTRSRRRALIAIAASLLLAAGSVAGWFIFRTPKPPKEDEPVVAGQKKPEEAIRTTGDPITPNASVRRPTLIDGVTTWNLVADKKVGPYYTLAWSHDKSQLFLRSSTNNYWTAWNKRTTGELPPAPFEGLFDSLSANGRLAVRSNVSTAVVGENPTLPNFKTTLRGLPQDWSIYRGPWLSPNGQWAAACIHSLGLNSYRLAVWSLKLTSKPAFRDCSSAVVNDVWDANTGRLILTSYQRGVEILEVSEDTNKEVVNLRLVKALPYDNVQVYGGKLSPDGKQFASLVSPSSGPECWVWDLETEQKRVIPGITWATNPPAWSPNGTRLACRLGSGNEVGVFDSATGKLHRKVEGHDEGTRDILFTPDGQTLITSGGDKLIRFWNAETGDLRGTLFMLPGGHWLAISPEGHFTGSQDVEKTKLFAYEVFQKGASRTYDYSPVEFEDMFGWKNDRSKVNLLGP